jgi:glycerol kinase
MLFDIEKLEWDETLCNKLGIPMSMLPEVKESSAIYGEIADNLPGLSSLKGIPIGGAIGDQQSALFGQACFNAGQAKNTYGTGCFLLMNTGDKRVRSQNQLIEGIAWGLNGKVTYDLEGSAFNAGSVIKWLRDELRMISEPSECDFLAESVEDSNGIYLVPAFTGLGAPYWDMYARGCIVGLTRGANRAHFARAVLESITYQVTDLIEAMSKDSEMIISEIRVDGGASVSNVMLQIQADMAGAKVNRPKLVETTALGAAYMAGLAVGFWKNLDEIEMDREVDRIFIPNVNTEKREKMLKGWHKAVRCSMNWEEA